MPNTQIAIPIDTARKQAFTKSLRTKNLTTKAFITYCIDAFINGELILGIVTSYDKDTYLTTEEKKDVKSALEEYKRGEYYTLEESKAEIGYTK